MTVEYSFPSFIHEGKSVVPINISELAIEIRIDVNNKQVDGNVNIRFSPLQSGYPMLDFVLKPKSIVLNGNSLPETGFPQIIPPENEAPIRILDVRLEGQSKNELKIHYGLSGPTIVFGNGGIRLGFFFNDLIERGFLERFVPANFEFDQFQMTLDMEIIGEANRHLLFCNGEITQITNQKWKVLFPEYFNCSSCFVHLTDRPVSINKSVFSGRDAEIPVTVYGDSTDVIEQAKSDAFRVMEELETEYGPYAHRDLLIYVARQLEPPLGGMEYCGATMTTLYALPHEITHSWFGRGIMPANGNSGWIDEAIARWRDNEYPRASGPPNRNPVQLSGFSPYRRHTTLYPSPYSLGSLLLSELDYLFRNNGGLRPILKDLFSEKRRKLITTPVFQKYLEQKSGVDLNNIFSRYVYGRSGDDPSLVEMDISRSMEEPVSIIETQKKVWGKQTIQQAPRPFTMDELKECL